MLDKEVFDGDEVAGGRLQGHITVQEFRTEDAYFRVFLHISDHFVDGAVQHFAVGIQAEDIFAAADDDGLVVGFGEPGVFLVLDDDDIGEFFPESGYRTVFGIVVGDDDFEVVRFSFVIDRLDAGDGEMLFVGVDDGDGQFFRLGVVEDW